MINPPPIDSAVSGVDKEFHFSWKKWINQLFKTVQAIQNVGTYTYQVPLTGFSISFPANTETLQLDPAGVLATGTIALPTNPVDGQSITIATTNTVTAVALTSSSTIKNPPASLSSSLAVKYYYSSSNNTWYRLT